MTTKIEDFRERFHVPIWALGPLLVAMAGMFTYLQLNFASASDAKRIEQKVDNIETNQLVISLTLEIQGYMQAICSLGATPSLTIPLQSAQEKYFKLTGHYYPWICEQKR